MPSSSFRTEWRLKDPYGQEWRISLVRSGEQAEAPAPTFEARSALDVLVFAAFDHHGALGDALSAGLLEVYDGAFGVFNEWKPSLEKVKTVVGTAGSLGQKAKKRGTAATTAEVDKLVASVDGLRTKTDDFTKRIAAAGA